MVYHCSGVIIRDEDKILLHRRDYEPRKGTYDLVGGFVDDGEDYEAAAIREAKEETGHDVRLVRKIVDYDTFEQSEKVLHIYEGEIIGGELQSSEEGEPVWIAIDDIKEEMLSFPHTYAIIRIFLNQ